MINRAELKAPWQRHAPARWMSTGAVAVLLAWLFAQNRSTEAGTLTPLYALGPVVASIGLPAPCLLGVGLLCAVLALVEASGTPTLGYSLAAIAVSTGVALRHASVAETLWESGRRWRAIFSNVGTMLWVEDYSAVKVALDVLRAQGVEDFPRYLADHPDFPTRMLRHVEIIDVNPTTLALFGAPSKTEFLASHQCVLQASGLPFAQVLETIWDRAPSLRAEALLRRLDGTQIPVTFAITFSPERPLLDRVVVSITDLSALHQIQENLSESRRALAHATRLTTMGELTASIAHELNQPLGAVVVQGQAALRFLKRPKPDLAEVQGGVTQMVDDALRASEILHRLRNFARRAERTVEPVDLNALIQKSCGLIKHDLRQHGASVRLALAPDLPPVPGERVELQQILINLVINAAQAMSQVEPGRRVLTVATALEDDRIVLSVADHGPGLGEGDVETLFQPFVTSKADGMGMGLAIVRSIVETHGGSIQAFNNPDGGATFAVRLPAHD